jgi:uncharacterized protein (DUF2236 family)
MIEGVPALDTTALPLFTDASMIRRVHSESIVLLGGGRALLMQVAHPLVATGVAEHSSFRHDRIGRLLRTLRPTLALAFGTPEQVRAAATRINAIHETVAGPGYRATDPALLAWVMATLIDTGLLMHERFVRPLRSEEAEAYYRDMQACGRLLGIPDGALPEGLTAFHTYVASMVESLHVSEEAREIGDAIFAPKGPIGPVMLGLRAFTAGLLPPRLRDAFGLGWGPRRGRVLSATEAVSRRIWPLLPPRLRLPPPFLLPPKQRT